jgi:ribonuclease BN (tRNA processing enzyme)
LIGALRLLEKPGMFPIEVEVLPKREFAEVLRSESFRINCSPVKHSAENIGVRIEEQVSGRRRTVVYSSDTEPCDSLVLLAKDADILIHEAFTYEVTEHRDHSTAAQAGKTASQASVKTLLLVHMDPAVQGRTQQLIAEAAEHFSGAVIIPNDLTTYPFEI